MMNPIHVTAIGELQQVLAATLYDTDPATGDPRVIDLTNYISVKITVAKSSGEKIIDDVDCDIDAIPTTGNISFTYDCTVTAFSNLVPGDHLMRFKLTAPSGKVTMVPKKDKDTFGIFRVLADL